MRRILLALPFLLLFCATGRAQSVGCGATNWISPSSPPVQYDQTTCGNVTTDGSVLSYEPGYNDATATNLNTLGCGATYTTQGPVSFKLTADLNCGATSNAFNIRPNAGAGHVGYFINLAGHTITGTVTVDDNNGGFPDGTHFFGGSWTCSARPCLGIFWTNGADIVSNPMTVHHITWNNTSDSGSMTSIGANGSGVASIPYTIVQHHNDITLSGGTAGDPNRTTGLTENGLLQKVAYFNNKIQDSAGTNHGASEGMTCYNASACDVHNNWISLNQMTLANGTPGRGILLDGDAFGNGPSENVTSNGQVFNNYCSVQNTRCVRARSASNFSIHDNLIDNCTDGNSSVTYQACGTHWGDPTTTISGNATYNYGTSLIYHNIYFLAPKVTNGGRAHWGNNATGISFKEERISCISTGCSGNTTGNPYQRAGISNKTGTQFFNITLCNLTTDFAFGANGTADGGGQTQTSTSNNFSVGTITASNGAVNNALTSCPAIATATDIYYAQAAAGNGTGLGGCTNAKALPVAAGDQVAGNTIHLCGTVNTALNTTGIAIVGWVGTSSSPITVLAEPGFVLQSSKFSGCADGPAPPGSAASEGGAIDISSTSRFIIVDGGTNGIIQNTANGTSLANQGCSLGIWTSGDNIIVRNWTIQNIYNRVSGTTTGAGGSTADLFVSGGATSIKVCNNTLNNASIGAELNFHTTPLTPGITSWTNPSSCQSNAFTPGAIFGNNTMDDHNWMSHVNGIGAPVIINNTFGPIGWSNWNNDNNDFHSDGYFVEGNSAAAFKPYFITNYMFGAQAFPSGMFLFTDNGTASSGEGQQAVLVGNVMYGTGAAVSCCQGIGIQAVVTGNPKGPYQWYNNTTINFAFSVEDYAWQVASPTIDVRNNIYMIPVVTTAGFFFHNEATGWSFSTATINGNNYFGGRSFNPGGPFGLWTSNVLYPAWKTNCVAASPPGALCDTNSAFADPLLAGESSFASGSALTPSGFVPAANSPAANLGDNLSSQCASIPNQCAGMPQTVGAGGSCGTGCIARPASGRWTAGAFQISGGAVSPNAPTGLTGTVTGSTVNLSWTAPTGTPAPTAYTEYRGTVHGGPYTAIQSGLTTTSTTDTPASGTYFYTVTAFVGGIVSNITGNGTTATVTCTAACVFPTGAVFTIAGNTQTSFNGTFTSTGQPTGSTFTFASSTNASGTGGGAWQSGAESAKSNEITVTTPATLTVTLLPASLAFGSFTVGTPSGTKQVTLTNTSAAGNTVTITSKSFSGANPGDYSETDNCPSLLLSGVACTFNITFTPTAVGTRSATLSVFDNASGSPQTTAVSGTGVAAAPAVSLSPTSLNFGDQTVGVTSVSRGITLTNTGTGTLSISSIVASGDFAQGNTCGATVAPLASCAINVTFTPSVSGIRTGTITITDNAAGSPQVANLTGNGTTTKCQITANATLSGQAVVCGP